MPLLTLMPRVETNRIQIVGMAVFALWAAVAAARGQGTDARETLAQLRQRFEPRLGQLIVTQLAAAPFPHPARAEGHKYHDKFYSTKEHYSDSTVAIFVPKGFHETGQIDFVVHFHGWNSTVTGTLDQYKLIEQ